MFIAYWTWSFYHTILDEKPVILKYLMDEFFAKVSGKIKEDRIFVKVLD